MGITNDQASLFIGKLMMSKLASMARINLHPRVLIGCKLSSSSLNHKTLRIYFSTNIQISHETLSTIFTSAFNEFGQMSRRINISEGSIFNLVPVLGAGRSATSMDDILTCELYARKF
ncbi:uncharacterized protein LOC111397971 [Olea europaea var. sylvestris]|uniref:uncharacterized protein LOC111397971 n=1 Tax=Olea europaea var. sylvestris TaxID=158386 RepID=UPI000C1D874A|nr:uncharacterized protein LOC111397971 [Olea europaea var. sylvestris]